MNKVANNKVLSPNKGVKLNGSGLGKVIAVTALVTLVGCSSGKWGFPYRAPVQQGNWETAEQVSYLRPGLTQSQVLYVLGTPTLVDIFHPNRWDYPYYFKPGYGDPVQRNLSLWFDENGLLERWEHDPLPETQPGDFQTQQLSGIPTVGQSQVPTEQAETFNVDGETIQIGFETSPLED